MQIPLFVFLVARTHAQRHARKHAEVRMHAPTHVRTHSRTTITISGFVKGRFWGIVYVAFMCTELNF